MADSSVSIEENGSTSIDTFEFAGQHIQKMLPNFLVGTGGGDIPIDVSRESGMPMTMQTNGKDAFGAMRMSEPKTLFSSIPRYDLNEVQWQNIVAGSGTATHDSNNAAAKLTVTANASDSVVRQSKIYLPYQAGHSQLIRMKFFMNAGNGVETCAGPFDDENGFFFRKTAVGGLEIVRRSSTSGFPVDDDVAQAAWNIDKLDGTGASQATLDITKAQHMVIDYEGSVGFARIGFQITGRTVYCHTFQLANTITTQMMQYSSLPLRYEISSDGSGAGDLFEFSSTVLSESGFIETLGNTFGQDNGTTTVAVGVGITPLISIRPKLTINSIINRALIGLASYSVYSVTNAVRYGIIYGGTLGGSPVWNSADSHSATEFDVAASSITGGVLVDSDYTDKKAGAPLDLKNAYPVALDESGAHPTTPLTDTITLFAQQISGGTNAYGAIEWTEIV